VRVARQEISYATPRRFYKVENMLGARGDMPNNDVASALHALVERVYLVETKEGFARPPLPLPELGRDEAAFEQRRVYFRGVHSRFTNQFKRFAHRRGAVGVSPYSPSRFLEDYGGAQRSRYEQAFKSMVEKPFEHRDGRISLFTKDEYRDWKERDGMWVPKPPRAIQTRSPRFHVALGTYLNPIEDSVYHVLNEIHEGTGYLPTVAKGMNLDQRGKVIAAKWRRFRNPVALELDASRYDQHQHDAMLADEHLMYRFMSTGISSEPHLPSLARLLLMQRINRGVYKARRKRARIRYKVRGCRASGDKNTSLGNIFNMCKLMYTYLREVVDIDYELLNDGDDNVLIIEQHHLDKVSETLVAWFETQGITMKLEGVATSLEDIVFCQASPVYINGQYRMVPNPRKRLYSDLMTSKPIASKRTFLKWLGAVAGCGMCASAGVPIFQSYYAWVGKETKPWKPTPGHHYYRFRDDLTDGMEAKDLPISEETRFSFWKAFGITPWAQMSIESHFNEMPAPSWTEPTHCVSTPPLFLTECPTKWDKIAAPNRTQREAEIHLNDTVRELLFRHRSDRAPRFRNYN